MHEQATSDATETISLHETVLVKLNKILPEDYENYPTLTAPPAITLQPSTGLGSVVHRVQHDVRPTITDNGERFCVT